MSEAAGILSHGAWPFNSVRHHDHVFLFARSSRDDPIAMTLNVLWVPLSPAASTRISSFPHRRASGHCYRCRPYHTHPSWPLMMATAVAKVILLDLAYGHFGQISESSTKSGVTRCSYQSPKHPTLVGRTRSTGAHHGNEHDAHRISPPLPFAIRHPPFEVRRSLSSRLLHIPCRNRQKKARIAEQVGRSAATIEQARRTYL